MFKRLFVIVLVAGAGYAAWQAAHPAPAAGQETAAAVEPSATLGGRLKLKIGAIATSIAGNQIRATIAKTDRELAGLTPAIKRTQGSAHTRAMKSSKRIAALDSLSTASLDADHPVAAIKLAMDARGYIEVIRQEVRDETAAR